jgi:hypothetical protein
MHESVRVNFPSLLVLLYTPLEREDCCDVNKIKQITPTPSLERGLWFRQSEYCSLEASMSVPVNLQDLSQEELAERLFGENWLIHPEYIAMMESIERGRARASVSNDLRDRLRHLHSRELGSLPRPYEQPSGW